MESKRRQNEDEVKVRELQARLKTTNEAQVRLLAATKPSDSQTKTETTVAEGLDPAVCDVEEEHKVDTTDSQLRLIDKEAKLIG